MVVKMRCKITNFFRLSQFFCLKKEKLGVVQTFRLKEIMPILLKFISKSLNR